MSDIDLSNYVDVAERIRDFRTKHPEGCLQSEIVPLHDALADRFIAVRATAYRTPDDPRPGVGLAYEPVPGKTPFTRDSELQNAETSAWGRAIVAVGAADTQRGIASRQEVANRATAAEEPPLPPITPDVAADLKARLGALGTDAKAGLRETFTAAGLPTSMEAIPVDRYQDALRLISEAETGSIPPDDPAAPGATPTPETPQKPTPAPLRDRYDGYRKDDLIAVAVGYGIAETGTVADLDARLRSFEQTILDRGMVLPACPITDPGEPPCQLAPTGGGYCREHEPM